MKVPFRKELAGGGDAFHGGAIGSLLDLAGSRHESINRQNQNNFIAAALGTDVIAMAHAVKRGKELIFCSVDITESGSGRLIANGSMIYRIA